MQFTIATLAAVVSIVAADTATVHNNCQYDIFVQSFSFGAGPDAPPTIVPTGKDFTLDQRQDGLAIKIDKSRTFDSYLEFDSSSGGGQAFYQLKNPENQGNNPFSGEHNVIDPGTGCDKHDCAPGDTGCYQIADPLHCPQPVDLTATVCA